MFLQNNIIWGSASENWTFHTRLQSVYMLIIACIIKIKTKIPNLVRTTRFWNDHHYIMYPQIWKIGKPNNLKRFEISKPKDLSRITYGWGGRTLALMKITLFRSCKFQWQTYKSDNIYFHTLVKWKRLWWLGRMHVIPRNIINTL